jgi:hypothetical protein
MAEFDQYRAFGVYGVIAGQGNRSHLVRCTLARAHGVSFMVLKIAGHYSGVFNWGQSRFLKNRL